MRKLAASLVLPVIAAGSLIATSSPAGAALPSNTIRKAPVTGLTCSGSVVTKKVAYVHGSPVGILKVYIQNKNYGTISACFFHYGATAGKVIPTSVTLLGYNTQSLAGKPAAMTTSAVRTKVAAGPVALNHVKILNHCFVAAGVVQVSGKNVVVTTDQMCWVRIR